MQSRVATAKASAAALVILPTLASAENLLRNAGFELANPLYPSVPAVWSPLSPPPAWWELSRSTTSAHSGQRALRLAGQCFYQSVAVQGGRTYTLSAFARRASPGASELSLWVNGCGLDHVQQFALTEAWQRSRLTITPKSSGGVAVRVGVFRGVGWVDDVQFEPGENPTEFSPERAGTADALLDIGVDPFHCADLWHRRPKAPMELNALLKRHALSEAERARLRMLGDHFFEARDDWRASLAYERWLAGLGNKGLGIEVVRERLAALRSVLRRRSEWLSRLAYFSPNHAELDRGATGDPNFPFVEALQQRGATDAARVACYPNEVAAARTPLEAAMDQVYYYPWESQAVLTLFLHKRASPSRLLVSVTDLRSGKIVWRSEGTPLLPARVALLSVPLHELEDSAMPERRYRLHAIAGGPAREVRGDATADFGIVDFRVPSAPSVRSLRLRKDGVLIVNEEPFLPLGIWDSYFTIHQQLYDRLVDMASHGFNLGPAALPVVRHPALLCFSGPRVEKDEIVLPAGWSRDPGLLGWHWWDEPFYQLDHPENLNRIVEVYRALRSLDPRRPVLINGLNEVRHYVPFASVGDIFGTEPYDVGPAGVEYYLGVAKRARQESKADHPIAVWSLPGTWRHPTPGLVRTEAYTALLHDAKGLYWYAYETDANPRPCEALQALQWNSVNLAPVHAPLTWSAFRGLTAELRQLAPYFTSEEPPLSVEVAPPRVVQARLFHLGGKGVIVAVAEHEPVALGRWEWREAKGRLVHRGWWEKPSRFPRFFAAADLPKPQGKGLHGLVNLEPIAMSAGDGVEQEVWCGPESRWVSLRPVIDEVVETYWVHPVACEPVRWESNTLLKGGSRAVVSLDAQATGLTDRKVVGFYFESDSEATWWGRTWLVHEGKRRLWFDRGAYEYARKGGTSVQLTLPVPQARVSGSVLFEPRAARCKGNVVWDNFMPGAVHCYAVTGLP